ncbi:response regulator transcription factor [Anabaena minutissima FACHB-250]|nr:response regulator transcription factor [Anabaena minutissima FACHB-250]
MFENYTDDLMSLDLTPSSTLKILIIDDHQLILTGTVNVLQKQYPTAAIARAKTAADALLKIADCEFDLIVMDLSIPEQAGAIASILLG